MKVKGYKIKAGANLHHADLRYADLRGADLRGANLQCASLRDANLHHVDLRGADLRGADLRDADLTGATLWGANLYHANLRGADLREADLWDADLRHADLYDANLRDVNLRKANLWGTILTLADLRHTNLSDAKGLLNGADWLKENFKFDDKGRLIVYKAFGATNFPRPYYWKVIEGSVIEENVNLSPTVACGCGVNFATFQWCMDTYADREVVIRECYIEPIDLAGVVVPYSTNGKARCSKLTIGKIVERE